LRVALQTNTLTTSAVNRARPLADLAQIVTGQLEPLRRACDYAAIGRLLPDVLDELHYHAPAPADEAAQRLALGILVEACVGAAITPKNLNYAEQPERARQPEGDVTVICTMPSASSPGPCR
jgi:hypothetical protein